jgi:hypothetical protein
VQNIIIVREFQFLLPELDEVTFRGLEESILEFGCLVPLTLWNGILIDGYHRFRICTEHNLPFTTIEIDLDSRDEVKIWIIETQVRRRNLTPLQLSYYRGLHYNMERKLHGGDRRSDLKNSSTQNGDLKSGRTTGHLSDKYNVSKNTIYRDSKLAETLVKMGEISPEALTKILSGEVAINKSTLEALASSDDDSIEIITKQIEDGTYSRRETRSPEQSGDYEFEHTLDAPNDEIRKLGIIISDFAKSFNSMYMNTGGEPTELKSVLRTYIDRLEELYKGM